MQPFLDQLIDQPVDRDVHLVRLRDERVVDLITERDRSGYHTTMVLERCALVKDNLDMAKPFVDVRADAKKMRYIEWLTTVPDYRRPKTEKELAAELDVYPKTLYNWRQDRDFRDVWRDESDEVIGGADRRQAVLETLYRAATDERNPRHVAAGKLYLEAIGAMAPGRVDVTVTGKAVSALTEEELDYYIGLGVAELRGEKPDGPGRLPAEEHTG